MIVRAPDRNQSAPQPGGDVDAEAGTEPHEVDPDPGGMASGPAHDRSRRPLVAGVASGLWAFLIGMALITCAVMLTWTVSPNPGGDSAAAWRAAGLTWLGLHQIPIAVSGASISLLPVGGLALGLLLNRRGGRWAGSVLPEPSLGELTWIVAGSSLTYAIGGAGVAWISSTPGEGARPVQAFLISGTIAAVGMTWGVARSAGLLPGLRAGLSDAVWRTLAAGIAAAMGLFAAGSALVTISLIRNAGQVAETLHGLSAGVVGSLMITVLGILCLPTLAIWGMAVVVGPGVQVGDLGWLSAFSGNVEALPAIPVLAAVPTAPPAGGWAMLIVPVLLGVVASRIRWGRDLPTLAGALSASLGVASVVAVIVGGMVALASGSIGGGRLADVGPHALSVSAAAAGLVAFGMLLEAGMDSVRLTWQLYSAEQRGNADRVAAGRVAAGVGRDEADVIVDHGDVEPVVQRAPGIIVVGAIAEAGTGAGAQLAAAAEGPDEDLTADLDIHAMRAAGGLPPLGAP